MLEIRGFVDSLLPRGYFSILLHIMFISFFVLGLAKASKVVFFCNFQYVKMIKSDSLSWIFLLVLGFSM